MQKQRVSAIPDGMTEPAKVRKLPFVPAWKTFSKQDEDEKEKTFNSMRAELMALGRMESGK